MSNKAAFVVFNQKSGQFLRGGVPPRWGRVDQARQFSDLPAIVMYFRRIRDWKNLGLPLADLAIINLAHPETYIPARDLRVPKRAGEE